MSEIKVQLKSTKEEAVLVLNGAASNLIGAAASAGLSLAQSLEGLTLARVRYQDDKSQIQEIPVMLAVIVGDQASRIAKLLSANLPNHPNPATPLYDLVVEPAEVPTQEAQTLDPGEPEAPAVKSSKKSGK